MNRADHRQLRWLSVIGASLGVLAILADSGLAQDNSAPVMMSRNGGGIRWSSLADLQKFAARGNPKACAQLGEDYLTGTEVKKDVSRAVPLLETAARGGEPSAAFRLGMLFDDGNGVPQDRTKALLYFRAAAAGGAAEALHNIGAAYGSARGLPRDYVEALAWFLLARAHGADDGPVIDKVRDWMQRAAQHPEWIPLAETRSREIAADLQRNTVAEWLARTDPLPPGTHPVAGKIVSDRVSPAVNPAAVVSGTGHDLGLVVPDISDRLGLRHDDADDAADAFGPPIRRYTPTNRLLTWPSLHALQRGADRGEDPALYVYGTMLVDGDGVPEDAIHGAVLLERAAADGDADAAQRLAELYAAGIKLVRDDQKVLRFSLQAARAGSASAMFNLGSCYTSGRGVPQDYTESLAWFILAKKNGYDRGGEKRIRDYLTKTHPEQVAAAEARAAKLGAEIAKK